MIVSRLRNPSTFQPPSRVWLFVVMVGVILLMAVNVLLSAELSHYGMQMAISEQKVAALQASALKINQEIAKSTALTDLQDQAYQLGYTTNVAYLNLPGTTRVAYKP